jgi:hypothetical protein
MMILKSRNYTSVKENAARVYFLSQFRFELELFPVKGVDFRINHVGIKIRKWLPRDKALYKSRGITVIKLLSYSISSHLLDMCVYCYFFKAK